MQGMTRLDRDLWDAGEITGHLVPPGSVFAFLAEHRTELFPDSFTADLFPSRTGRPSLPADLVGSVLVLKELYDLPDAQTADALTQLMAAMRKVARVVENFAASAATSIPSLLVSRQMLERHLDWLGRRFRFVSLDELGARLDGDR